MNSILINKRWREIGVRSLVPYCNQVESESYFTAEFRIVISATLQLVYVQL